MINSSRLGTEIRVGHLDAMHISLKKNDIKPNCWFPHLNKGYSHGMATSQVLHNAYTSFSLDNNLLNYLPINIENGNKILINILSGLDIILNTSVKIILLPISLPHIKLFCKVMETIETRDILLIAPAGNKGISSIFSPGVYSQVLCVGAIDDDNQVARFSNYSCDKMGNCVKPELLARGVNIPAIFDNVVSKLSGTSFACATVAGLCAALFEANPNATTNDVKVALFESCTPAAGSRYGVIDADKAMENILNKVPYATKPEQSKLPSFYGETYIDHRLKRQCKKAQKRNEKVEAIVVADSTKALMARLSEKYNNTDFEFTLFRNFDMAHVTATPSFYEALFTQPDIQVCSAVDINYFDI